MYIACIQYNQIFLQGAKFCVLVISRSTKTRNDSKNWHDFTICNFLLKVVNSEI